MFKQISSSMNKMFNSKNQITNLAHNQYILYFLFLIALGNLYYLVMNGENLFAVLFILVGFVTSFFSKNMIIILFLALCITNILRFGGDVITKEGFEDKEIVPEDEENPKKFEKENEKLKNTEEKIVSIEEKNGAKEDALAYMKKIKSHATEILDVQNELVDNMMKMDPVLSKAQEIIARFDKLKENKGDIVDKLKKFATDTKQLKK